MNTPTNDDLNRLVDEGWRTDKPADGEPVGQVYAAMHLLSAVLASLALGRWADARAALIRAMLLCGLAAWGAGRRVQSPAGQDFYGVALGRDLNGKLRPLDPPTSAETPEAKGAYITTIDVDELIMEADGGIGNSSRDRVRRALIDQRDALRAERERAERATEAAGLAYSRAFDLQEHLRAVLRTGWAHSAMAPSVVQKARVFLEDPSAEQPMGPNRTRYALRCADLRAREAEAERDALRAKLAAEDEAHGHTRELLADLRSDLAKADRSRTSLIVERNAAADLVTAYRSENLDLRAKNQELVQRVEGLEKAQDTWSHRALKAEEKIGRLDSDLVQAHRTIDEISASLARYPKGDA